MKKIIFFCLPLFLGGCGTLRETDPEFLRSAAEKIAELLSKL